jgi:hypothetical protein
MARRCLHVGATAVLVVSGLLLGHWGAGVVTLAWFADSDAGGARPTAVLPCTQRDLGAVCQGVILRTAFPIRNLGTRRLILLQQSQGCCGQPAGQTETAVLPGEATELIVEADTSRWCGRLRKVVHYTTNDPDLPRFALTLSARVEAAAGEAEGTQPDSPD